MFLSCVLRELEKNWHQFFKCLESPVQCFSVFCKLDDLTSFLVTDLFWPSIPLWFGFDKTILEVRQSYPGYLVCDCWSSPQLLDNFFFYQNYITLSVITRGYRPVTIACWSTVTPPPAPAWVGTFSSSTFISTHREAPDPQGWDRNKNTCYCVLLEKAGNSTEVRHSIPQSETEQKWSEPTVCKHYLMKSPPQPSVWKLWIMM